jgi:hydroxyethylthiazole kinase
MISNMITADIYDILQRVRDKKPLVHHITNWVTIYDCANIVKVLGASPVMAHAPEEVEEMAGISSSLVLNIGTLTAELVGSMKKAARRANSENIPVILDVCGAGATKFRDQKCMELLGDVRIDIIKGNQSEIARIYGKDVKTRGVDAGSISLDLACLAKGLALKENCCVAITGEKDFVSDGKTVYVIENGTPKMAEIVGTGCMSTSVVGTFAAVEKDYALASAAGLCVFEIACELAARKSRGHGHFKERIFDLVPKVSKQLINKYAKVKRLK